MDRIVFLIIWFKELIVSSLNELVWKIGVWDTYIAWSYKW